MINNSNVITLGCRLNFWESNKINSFISKDKKNQIVIFNTCSVTNEAVKNAKKAIKNFHKLNPEVKIILTGCAVETDYDLFNSMDEVSFIVRNKDKLSSEEWQNIQSKITGFSNKKLIFKNMYKENPSNSNIRKFVKIQSGCDHSCTFCIIPKCRGKSQSENIDKVNNEISKNIALGVKEIILTGVDITSWKDDANNKFFLGDLIEGILNSNTKYFRLRLSSIDAAELDHKLIELIEKDSRLMPHFHFSLQSLDDLILKRMKRRHDVNQVVSLFKRIKSLRASVTFGADFICGFPTETEEMFMNTLKLVKKLNITHLHVFPFSPKSGTPASRMPQTNLLVSRKRAKALREVGRINYLEFLKSQLKKEHQILIENDQGLGKTENNLKVIVKNAKKGMLVKLMPKKIYKDYLIVD